MTDGLIWVRDVPFRYYMLGFRDFVMSGQFDFWASDAASCFLGIVLALYPRGTAFAGCNRLYALLLLPGWNHGITDELWTLKELAQ